MLLYSESFHEMETEEERRRARETESGERERQGKRESPGEVNGWNARWGSVNELHAGLGGFWRYCVEAAGVTVAVTDTKTTFHGRRHWLKAVARPLPADHTLSINNHFFLWWILCDWLWWFFYIQFFFFLEKNRNYTCWDSTTPPKTRNIKIWHGRKKGLSTFDLAFTLVNI